VIVKVILGIRLRLKTIFNQIKVDLAKVKIASRKSLYEQDLNLWLETAIAQLKSGNLPIP
jgi:hypothetical protein